MTSNGFETIEQSLDVAVETYWINKYGAVPEGLFRAVIRKI